MHQSSGSTSYRDLARVYDRLMSDAPYNEWIRYAHREWAKVGMEPKSVIDLACGTGTITKLLVKEGYQVIGIDLSEEMLAVTFDKLGDKASQVRLYKQDMRQFMVPNPVDALVCFCDSISYLLTDEDVLSTFASVYRALNSGGVFLFDVHSPYKINQVYGTETFTLSDEDMAYIWQCYSLENDIVEHDLDIFVKDQAAYIRFTETHQQRGFSAEAICSWLEQAGFADIDYTADFLEQKPTEVSERLFFRAVKK